MRFYRAVCAYIEARTAQLSQDEGEQIIPPSGADAMVERSGQHEPDELSAHYNRDESELFEDRIGFNMPRRKP